MLPAQQPPLQSPREAPLLFAERAFTGHGQEHGGVQTILYNPSPDRGVDFVYLESLPWFMKPYLHTLTVREENKQPNPDDQDAPEDEIIKDMYYRPAMDRVRGTQLEVRMHVRANSTVVLSYEFEKAILRYTEYPPDANRGFDVAPAIIAVYGAGVGESLGAGPTHYIRTTSLLLNLPTPDFSMPYNVIILTSTVMALAFGSIFNLLVRRFAPAEEVPSIGVRVAGVLAGLRGKVVVLLRRRGVKKKKEE